MENSKEFTYTKVGNTKGQFKKPPILILGHFNAC